MSSLGIYSPQPCRVAFSQKIISQIQSTNDALQNNARLVINRYVTAKAWLTGYYIVEYEQNGSDRAKYGEKLLQNLSKRLGEKNFSYRSLKLYRQFFVTFVGLFEPIKDFVFKNFPIRQSLIAQFESLDSQVIEKSQSVTGQFKKDKALPIGQSVIAQLMGNATIGVAPDKLFNRLSFTHLAAILPCKDPLQRAFYETMAIRGTWSVRELQRQIDSNYYERSSHCHKANKNEL